MIFLQLADLPLYVYPLWKLDCQKKSLVWYFILQFQVFFVTFYLLFFKLHRSNVAAKRYKVLRISNKKNFQRF